MKMSVEITGMKRGTNDIMFTQQFVFRRVLRVYANINNTILFHLHYLIKMSHTLNCKYGECNVP